LKLISGPAIEPIEVADFLANDEWFKSHSMPQNTQDYLTASCINADAGNINRRSPVRHPLAFREFAISDIGICYRG
jgi:hypothetical protein